MEKYIKIEKRIKTLDALITSLFNDNAKLRRRNERLEKFFDRVNGRDSLKSVYNDIKEFKQVVD